MRRASLDTRTACFPSWAPWAASWGGRAWTEAVPTDIPAAAQEGGVQGLLRWPQAAGFDDEDGTKIAPIMENRRTGAAGRAPSCIATLLLCSLEPRPKRLGFCCQATNTIKSDGGGAFGSGHRPPISLVQAIISLGKHPPKVVGGVKMFWPLSFSTQNTACRGLPAS